MSGIDSLLRACRILSDEGKIGVENFKKAAEGYAGEKGIAKLVLETHLHEGPPSQHRNETPVVTKERVLYSDPSADSFGEPVTQRFIIDED
ncbi:MAG: hypothetical protein IK123_07170, partial [Lachnospiraceae bacterium]|nr:hypothetical protein [Lachnospiraceae bacterium]